MLASFRAMATVVRHYRSLVLFAADGTTGLSAIDPTEDGATAAALVRDSRTGAGAARPDAAVQGPGRGDARALDFYLYRFPVDEETVVIAIEAPRLLQSAMRSVPDGRILVTDPGGAEWTGCGVGGAPCVLRPASARTLDERSWTDASGTAWVGDRTAEAFGLPRQDAAAGVGQLRIAGAGELARPAGHVRRDDPHQGEGARAPAAVHRRGAGSPRSGWSARSSSASSVSRRPWRRGCATPRRCDRWSCSSRAPRSWPRRACWPPESPTRSARRWGSSGRAPSCCSISCDRRTASARSKRSSSRSIASRRRSGRCWTSRGPSPSRCAPIAAAAAVRSSLDLLDHRFQQQRLKVDVDVARRSAAAGRGPQPAAAGADQPAAQRVRRLPAGRDDLDRGAGRPAATRASASTSATTAAASRTSTCSRCSIRSSRRRSAAREPGWGCRSPRASSATTAATSRSTSVARPGNDRHHLVAHAAEESAHVEG